MTWVLNLDEDIFTVSQVIFDPLCFIQNQKCFLGKKTVMNKIRNPAVMSLCCSFLTITDMWMQLLIHLVLSELPQSIHR